MKTTVEILYEKMDELIFQHMDAKSAAAKFLIELEIDHITKLIEFLRGAA